MPMVRSQVESQIKVRDFSAANVNIAPAEYGSWNEARTELMTERKNKLKAGLEARLASVSEPAAIEKLRTEFSGIESDIEHGVDHDIHTFAITLDCEYNFLSLTPQSK